MQQCRWCLLSDQISRPQLTYIVCKNAYMHMQSITSTSTPVCLKTKVTSSYAYHFTQVIRNAIAGGT